MVDNIKTFFRLLKIHGKMDLLWFLRDIKYCLLFILADIISAVATLSGVLLLSMQFNGIGSMKRYEILFMLGYAVLVDGLYNIFFIGNNMGQISRVIARGHLDHCIIQPVPLWIQLLTSGFSPISGSSLFLMGAGIVTYSLVKLEFSLSLLWFIKLAACLLCSLGIIIAIVYIFSISAFYTPVASEEISSEVLDFTSTKSYPLGGFSLILQTVFTTVLPVGLGAWVPSILLLNLTTELPSPTLPILGAITAILISITTILFKRGLNHYEKNSNPRYSGFGHR